MELRSIPLLLVLCLGPSRLSEMLRNQTELVEASAKNRDIMVQTQAVDSTSFLLYFKIQNPGFPNTNYISKVLETVGTWFTSSVEAHRKEN